MQTSPFYVISLYTDTKNKRPNACTAKEKTVNARYLQCRLHEMHLGKWTGINNQAYNWGLISFFCSLHSAQNTTVHCNNFSVLGLYSTYLSIPNVLLISFQYNFRYYHNETQTTIQAAKLSSMAFFDEVSRVHNCSLWCRWLSTIIISYSWLPNSFRWGSPRLSFILEITTFQFIIQSSNFESRRMLTHYNYFFINCTQLLCHSFQ